MSSSPPCPSQTCTHTISESDISFDLICSVAEVGDLSSATVFEWFYGVLNSSLPDGIMMTSGTSTSGRHTIASTLQFPSLQLSHAGVYTCRVKGIERLAERINITVNGTDHLHASVISMQ